MEEKDSYPFRFHQIPQIQEAEVARILDFCQVCVRGSRISLFATVPGAGSTQAVSNQLDQNDQGGENFPLLLLVLLRLLPLPYYSHAWKRSSFCIWIHPWRAFDWSRGWANGPAPEDFGKEGLTVETLTLGNIEKVWELLIVIYCTWWTWEIKQMRGKDT